MATLGALSSALPSVLLLPVASPASFGNYELSVENGINADRLDDWLGTEIADEIRNEWGDRIAAWGFKDNTREGMGSGDGAPMYWDRVHPGSTVALFSDRERYFTAARVIYKFVNPEASNEVWSSPSYRWMVLLGRLHELDLPTNVLRAGAGYQSSYNLNRQNNVVREWREQDLWQAIAPYLNELAPFEAESSGAIPGAESEPVHPARGVTRRVFDPNRPRPQVVSTSSLAPPPDPEVTEKKREQAVEGHKALLANLAERLVDLGWSTPEEFEGATDLFSTSPDGVTVLFEAKTVTATNAHKQVRSAIIQLLEYRHVHHDSNNVLCVVTNGNVPERSRELLTALKIDAFSWDGVRFASIAPSVSAQLSPLADS